LLPWRDFFLGEDVDAVGHALAEAGKHFAFGHVGAPRWAELVVGFVDEFPPAAPLEAEAFAERSEFAVKGVAAVVGFAVFGKNSDVYGEAEIVHGVTCGGFGDDLAGGCAAFGVEGGLLVEAAEAADALHIEVALRCEALGGADEGRGSVVQVGVERGQIALAAVVEGHGRRRKASMAKPNEIRMSPRAMWPGFIWRLLL
jgi:hypothetical protein